MGLYFRNEARLGNAMLFNFQFHLLRHVLSHKVQHICAGACLFLVCNAVLCVCMTRMRLCWPLIQKPTMLSYFWHQKSISRPQISGIWYFEHQNRTRTVEIRAKMIFKQIPIHFCAKLLHKLQPPGGTIFHKRDPPVFWLKIIIGYICIFCERPRLIQECFLKLAHPNAHHSVLGINLIPSCRNPRNDTAYHTYWY